jgi:hypothetical protein
MSISLLQKNHSNPRYIGLCEIFHPIIHGFNSISSSELLNHYIVFCSTNFHLNNTEYDDYQPSNNYEDSDESSLYSDSESEPDSDSESIQEINLNNNETTIILTNYAIINEFKYIKQTRYMCLTAYNNVENTLGRPLKSKTIRNYQNIIKSHKYLQPEIFEKIYVDGRCCAIIKTFWIKIIQRSWKNIFKERVRITKLRKSLNSILYWQRNGKWPENCLYMPGLNNIMNNYSKF